MTPSDFGVFIINENYHSQTKNMERYLFSKTLPKRPKWQNVIKTAQFVLRGGKKVNHDSVTLSLKEEIEKEILHSFTLMGS